MLIASTRKRSVRFAHKEEYGVNITHFMPSSYTFKRVLGSETRLEEVHVNGRFDSAVKKVRFKKKKNYIRCNCATCLYTSIDGITITFQKVSTAAHI